VKIVYSEPAEDQLVQIKEFIALDNNKVANEYLVKIKGKIEILSQFPYVGKINTTLNISNIRDFVVLGYKVIYKINSNNIVILAIYKHMSFDEKLLVALNEPSEPFEFSS